MLVEFCGTSKLPKLGGTACCTCRSANESRPGLYVGLEIISGHCWQAQKTELDPSFLDSSRKSSAPKSRVRSDRFWNAGMSLNVHRAKLSSGCVSASLGTGIICLSSKSM